MAIFGAALAPHDPNASNLNDAYVGPPAGHPLGFDGQGRDLLSRLLVGARTSILGPAARRAARARRGHRARHRRRLARRLVGLRDLGRRWTSCSRSPAILLAVLAAAVFGPGLTAATLALAVAYTPYVARVLRSAAVRERAREYIAAGEVQGLLDVAHLRAGTCVPNVAPLIVAQGTLLFGYAMVDLAAMSFIGLGVQSPQADWGVMVADGPARASCRAIRPSRCRRACASWPSWSR